MSWVVFEASCGLSVPADRSNPYHHDVKTSKQFIWAALYTVSELGRRLRGSATFISSLLLQNHSWQLKMALCSLHSSLSFISESSLKPSKLTGSLCVWQGRRPRGSLRWLHGLKHSKKYILSGCGGTALLQLMPALKRLLLSEKHHAQVH